MPRVREDETTTDEEIFQLIRRVNLDKMSEKAAYAAVPFVRGLMAERISLAEDILPEFAEIAWHSAKPRSSLKDPGTERQIRERHRKRLAAETSPRAPPGAFDDALSAGLHWTPQPPGGRPNFELESLKVMAGHA